MNANYFGSLIMSALATLIALTFHELAHGWVSTKLGDPTPRLRGRMTLNPLAHLDLIGTLLMVFTGFGWAKPVEINPQYYKNKKRDIALVSIAGPLANLILAVLGMFIIFLPDFIAIKTGNGEFLGNLQFFYDFMIIFIVRNLSFMIFNLIPIPPLDGSKVLGMFLSGRAYYKFLEYERYSMVFLLILSVTGVFSAVIGTGVDLIIGLLFNGIGSVLGIV